MYTTIKSKTLPAKPINKVKPAPKAKIVLGTGKHLAVISDTLFEDDLK
jgi:hypothetical protein